MVTRAHARSGAGSLRGIASGALRRAWRAFAELYWGAELCNDIPALAWFLLISLVPLALGLTAVATLALGDYAEAKRLIAQATSLLPKDAHDQLVQVILRTSRQSPLLLAGSIVVMVWVCSSIVGVLERCLRRLLRRTVRDQTVKSMVIGRLRQVGLAGVLAVVIVALVVGASAGTGIVGALPVDATLLRLITPLVLIVLSVGFCAGLYRITSNWIIGFRAALCGGALGGLMLILTPTAAGYYVTLVASRTPVGVFFVLSGVIFSCYIVALGLLMGTGVAARVQMRPDATSASTGAGPRRAADELQRRG